jgi:membrane-bound lytic murein transglycosylase D
MVVAARSDSAQIATLKAPKSRGKSSRGGGPVIVVRRGETLSTIAKRHGTTVTALRRTNRLPGSSVRAGQRLRLPAS